MLIPFENKYPEIHPTVFVAEGAKIIGKVKVGKSSSIWYNSIIRGDINSIVIGEGTNIQDNCVIHVDRNAGVKIGNNVTVGHNVVLHGCKIKDGALIGSGAVIWDGAEVGEEAIVGACAFVPPAMAVPPRTLVVGVPAKMIREITQEEIEKIRENTKDYIKLAEYHKEILEKFGK